MRAGSGWKHSGPGTAGRAPPAPARPTTAPKRSGEPFPRPLRASRSAVWRPPPVVCQLPGQHAAAPPKPASWSSCAVWTFSSCILPGHRPENVTEFGAIMAAALLWSRSSAIEAGGRPRRLGGAAFGGRLIQQPTSPAVPSRLTLGHRCRGCTTVPGRSWWPVSPGGCTPRHPPPVGASAGRPRLRLGRAGRGGSWRVGWRFGLAAVQALMEVEGDAAGDLVQVGGLAEQAGQAV